jgi:HAMP domain-containing protein
MVGIDSVLRLYSFTPLSNRKEVGAYVAVGIPSTVAFEKVNRILFWNLALLVLASILSLVATWWFGGFFIMSSVNRLLNTTKRLADGDLTVRTGFSYLRGEIGQLAHSFDQMAESLQFREVERNQAEKEIRLLQTITFAISEAGDVHSALKIVLQRVCEATGWVIGEAWVPNSDGTYLEYSPAWYSRVEGLENFRKECEKMTFPPGIGLPGMVWSSKKPAWIKDVALDPNFMRVAIAREVGLKLRWPFLFLSATKLLQ